MNDPDSIRQPVRRRSKVLVVVVAFQRRWNEIGAVPWLLHEARAAQAQNSVRECPVVDRVLVYDNSPLPVAEPDAEDPPGIIYVHDPINSGTRGAYQKALELCRCEGQDWILLLDQDTRLPDNFLARAAEARAYEPDVLVPFVRVRSHIVSPASLTALGMIRPVRAMVLPAGRTATAIASGSLVRPWVLRLLEHAPPQLWLDYVDHWLFRAIHTAGYRIDVIDVEINHDLSVSDIRNVPSDRLRSVWAAEWLFVQSLGLPARLFYRLRLASRLFVFGIVCTRCARQLARWMCSKGAGA